MTLGGVVYEVLVIGPASARREHVNALPWNSVLVPQVTGQTVAQAVVAAVGRGMGGPRQDRVWHRALRRLLRTDTDALLGSESEFPPFHELSKALERLESEDERWLVLRLLAARPIPHRPGQEDWKKGNLAFQELFARHSLEGRGRNERAWKNVFRLLRRRPDASTLNIV